MDQVKEKMSELEKNGKAEAIYCAASAYAIGLGQEQDMDKAIGLYTKSAKKGYAPAMNSLGLIHMEGIGVKTDYDKARELFEKAVEKNNSDAACNLGTMYEEVELPEFRELPESPCTSWSIGYNGEQRNGRLLTPILPEPGLEKKNISDWARVKRWEEEDVRVEEYLVEDAEWIIVSYGISSRVAKECINRLRAEGVKIGMIRPITLFPFPKKSIDRLDYSRVKGIIDIEMSIPSQMREDIELQVARRCPVYEYGRSGGILLDDETTLENINKIIGGEQ